MRYLACQVRPRKAELKTPSAQNSASDFISREGLAQRRQSPATKKASAVRTRAITHRAKTQWRGSYRVAKLTTPCGSKRRSSVFNI